MKIVWNFIRLTHLCHEPLYKTLQCWRITSLSFLPLLRIEFPSTETGFSTVLWATWETIPWLPRPDSTVMCHGKVQLNSCKIHSLTSHYSPHTQLSFINEELCKYSPKVGFLNGQRVITIRSCWEWRSSFVTAESIPIVSKYDFFLCSLSRTK